MSFYALVLMGTVGMCFMAASTDLVAVFLGLEISSISTYILAGYRRADPLGNEASLKYFLMGSFATAFLLYGIAFVYGPDEEPPTSWEQAPTPRRALAMDDVRTGWP